jgi:hypothetical protein
MRIVAIFESWHVGDGNYPPFDRGQSVTLSFEVGELKIGSTAPTEFWFKSYQDATCEFSGAILGRYEGLAAVEAGQFRFYVHGPATDHLERGARISGSGTLALDHYAWFEQVRSFTNPPNLFFETKIARIRKVQIPERFIQRHPRGKTMPTTVGPAEYTGEDVKELSTMKGQNFDEEFYLLDLDVLPQGAAAG